MSDTTDVKTYRVTVNEDGEHTLQSRDREVSVSDDGKTDGPEHDTDMSTSQIARTPDKRITIPEDMDLSEARYWLKEKEQEEEKPVDVTEEIHAYPMDTAVAFQKAIKEIFGWAKVDTTKKDGLFGTIEKPPQMRTVQTGPDSQTEVPWGEFHLPGIEGEIELKGGKKDGKPISAITGVVKRKHREKVRELAARTREIVRDESIYRGKAVRLNFDEPHPLFGGGGIGKPTFLDLSSVNPDDLVFSRPLERQIETSIFTPIRNPESCKRHGVPTKRGILLEGHYGTGKTMTAYVAAKHCVENGRTFIYLDNVERLAETILFAKRYAPALIFAEDIDRVVSKRDDEANELLNTIDGIESKDSEVMVVLTTNFVEDLDPAMYRPGRLDDVISVTPPDADAVKRLIRNYARGLLAEDADLNPAAGILAGEVPAIIREAVERAKLGAIRRGDEKDGKLTLTGEDLATAARSLKTQSDLLAEAEAEDEPEYVKKARAQGTALGEGIAEGFRPLGERLADFMEDGSRTLPSKAEGAETVEA